ncbi:LOW QUALITY PROTEIN: TBC1 domain family member 30-like [Ptychodera flava]|uniref:LOW QUALITY PROTEIN: TBC1 domain family member 30-like n=1 Tax=Ptychodera flava TaxID=63121 RepID=UPI00396A1CED
MATKWDETTSETLCDDTDELDDDIFFPSSPIETENDTKTSVDSHFFGMSGMGQRNPENATGGRERTRNRSSIVDGLLCEIYDKYHGHRSDSFDSDGFTECSSNSDAVHLTSSRSDTIQQQLANRHTTRLHRAYLNTKSVDELREMKRDLQREIAMFSARLVKQLKRRERRLAKLQKNQDVLTAILQAVSQKRRIDTRMRFSIEPLPGKNGYQQWYDALKAVVRLPKGIPDFFRRQIWLGLADNHIKSIQVDWDKTVKLAFNERSNPDDDKLGVQIVKDLHRTGCSGFCGQEAEEDRVVLKRVLLAYARWNKSVGYCQGFNVLAALILEVMERKEDDALKVMIYLIDHVLPDSYFANNLRALSVDMAVFRQLLHIKLPDLSKHLDNLQRAANDDGSGHYEPPLTNVFTMQWFLTLFATCLPIQTVLRVWDSVFLEGSEILLRTALAIWAKLGDRIEQARSADDFYSTMGLLTNEMLHDGLVDGDELIQTIYNMAPFPFPHLDEIREKYMYSITPFTPIGAMEEVGKGSEKMKRNTSTSASDEEIDIDEDDLQAINCFGVFAGMPPSPQKRIENGESSNSNDITNVSPGAFSTSMDMSWNQKISSAMLERMSMDVYALKRQYWKIQTRQQQAHVVYGSSVKTNPSGTGDGAKKLVRKNITPHIEKPPVMNHLFVGKKGLGTRNKRVTVGPRIASPTQTHATAVNHLRIRAHVNSHAAKTSTSVSSQESPPAESPDSDGEQKSVNSVREDDEAQQSSEKETGAIDRDCVNGNDSDDTISDNVFSDSNSLTSEKSPQSQVTTPSSARNSITPTDNEGSVSNNIRTDSSQNGNEEKADLEIDMNSSNSVETPDVEVQVDRQEPTLAVLIDLDDSNSSNSDDESSRKLSEENRTCDTNGDSRTDKSESNARPQSKSHFKFDVSTIAAKLAEDSAKTANKSVKQQQPQHNRHLSKNSTQRQYTKVEEGKTVVPRNERVTHPQMHGSRQNHSQMEPTHMQNQNGHVPAHQSFQRAFHAMKQQREEQKPDKPMTLLEMATQATTLSAHRTHNTASVLPTESQHPNETAVLPVQTVEEKIAAFSLNGKKKRHRSTGSIQQALPQQTSNAKVKAFNPFPQRALKSGLTQAKTGNKFGLYGSGLSQPINGTHPRNVQTNKLNSNRSMISEFKFVKMSSR